MNAQGGGRVGFKPRGGNRFAAFQARTVFSAVDAAKRVVDLRDFGSAIALGRFRHGLHLNRTDAGQSADGLLVEADSRTVLARHGGEAFELLLELQQSFFRSGDVDIGDYSLLSWCLADQCGCRQEEGRQYCVDYPK